MDSGHPLQRAIPTCSLHLNDELSYYCQTCNKRVCEECLQGRHASHKWMSNKKLARLIRQTTKNRCEEIEDMIRELINEDNYIEEDINRIEEERRNWISAINSTADMMVKKRRAGRTRLAFAEEITKMKRILKFFKTDIYEADDIVAVEMEEEFHIKKANVSRDFKISLQTNNQLKKLVFKKGVLSSDVIEQMFGDVVEDTTHSMIKVIELSHFTHINDSDYIDRVLPIENNGALIARSDEGQIDHVDIVGTVIKKLAFAGGYFVQEELDIVFSDFGDKIIRHITPSGIESDICSTAPLHPDGICKYCDGGFLVTLCSCFADEISPESYGEVHHIGPSGGIFTTYRYSEDMTNLFIHPRRVAQNTNTDICVVEYINRVGRSRLLVMSLSSEVRFIYKGQSSLKNMFGCNDVACDHLGRILLIDVLNHAVHLLSEDGHFIQYVLTEQSPLRSPQCLGLHRNTLWVGCERGVVRVYKYFDEQY